MKIWTTRDKDGELCIWLEKPTWCPKQSRWGGVNANGVYSTLEHAGLPEPPRPGGPEAIVEVELVPVDDHRLHDLEHRLALATDDLKQCREHLAAAEARVRDLDSKLLLSLTCERNLRAQVLKQAETISELKRAPRGERPAAEVLMEAFVPQDSGRINASDLRRLLTVLERQAVQIDIITGLLKSVMGPVSITVKAAERKEP